MLQTIVLALVQSVAEFLPISSSAHLILVPRLFGWQDQGMAMDIALHLGTLFSVLLYFRQDVRLMFQGCFYFFKRQFSLSQVRLVLNLIVACIPVFIIGFFCHTYIEEYFRNPRLIGVTAIVFGVLLYWDDKRGSCAKNIEQMSVKEAFWIGLAQVLALIPGVSRSGITMTAARFLGVNREEAARFSMLLSIPTIGAAGAFGLLQILTDPAGENPPEKMVLFGMLIAFAGGVLAIGFLMKWLKHSSFAIFALYRILLGLFLFYLF